MTAQAVPVDFARRTYAERARLATSDPEGEADAVAPLTLAELAARWDRIIAETPLTPDPRRWPEPASAKDPTPALADPWLIEGVLRPGRLMVVAAAEGTGKSHARLELGIRLATGHGSLFDHYPIPKAARVLLIEVENGPEEELRREEEVIERFGLARADLTDYWTLCLEGLDLGEEVDQAYIARAIRMAKPDVVIFDTGSSMVGEEWGTELKGAVRFLRQLAAEYGCAVVVAVHVVKPSRERKRGKETPIHGQELADVMGQWTRQADSVALMSPAGENVLWRMAKRVPPSTLLLAPEAGTFHAIQVVAGDDGSATTRDRVLGAIATGMADAGGIATYMGTTVRTVRRHIAALRRDGRVTASGPLAAVSPGVTPSVTPEWSTESDSVSPGVTHETLNDREGEGDMSPPSIEEGGDSVTPPGDPDDDDPPSAWMEVMG